MNESVPRYLSLAHFRVSKWDSSRDILHRRRPTHHRKWLHPILHLVFCCCFRCVCGCVLPKAHFELFIIESSCVFLVEWVQCSQIHLFYVSEFINDMTFSKLYSQRIYSIFQTNSLSLQYKSFNFKLELTSKSSHKVSAVLVVTDKLLANEEKKMRCNF